MHNCIGWTINVIVLSILLFSCSAQKQVNTAQAEKLAENDRFALFRYFENGQEQWIVKTTAASRSGTFGVETILDAQSVIQQTKIVSYPFSHGRQVLQPSFLNQFANKTAADPVRIGKDIHAITGATLSSAAMTDAVRESLAFASEHKHRMVSGHIKTNP